MVTFEAKVKKFIVEQELVVKGDRLLIACSGGIDSMGLLYFFIKLQHNLKIQLFVAHVDHMLRGETSANDRKFVEDFCAEHGIPIFSTAIPIPQLMQQEGGNSQAICRRERYAFFADVMEKNQINKLVTAHHADDQLESVLMALTKAGSLNGMKGIYVDRPFFDGRIIRPFLSVTKEEISEYLEQHGGTFREDGSNSKDDYTRNRFRHHIVPLLKKENHNASIHAVQFTQYLQQDDDYLNTLAQERFHHVVKRYGENSYVLKINLFQSEAVALQRRIILILLNYLYNDSNYTQGRTIISSIMNLCKSLEGSATIYLPNQFTANRKYDEIVFEQQEKDDQSVGSYELRIDEWTQLEGIRLYIGEASKNEICTKKNATKYYFDSKISPTPLRIRTRKDGDRISLKGMDKEKRLSRLFIDEKVPLNERNHWPLLVNANDEIIAVVGVRISEYLSKVKRPTDDFFLIIENE